MSASSPYCKREIVELMTLAYVSFLYVLGANNAEINVFNVNSPGKATVVQTFEFTSAAKAAGATISKFGPDDRKDDLY